MVIDTATLPPLCGLEQEKLAWLITKRSVDATATTRNQLSNAKSGD